MNKTKKRQLNIKNKLIAAIAMLLVSSIMMVSTTYAWFTLSTAPEVQGITTTVGSNGNLEIALAHPTGDNSLIGSEMGDANLAWVFKNLTWGNLLDLSDPSYSLDELTLLPSRLNISKVTDTSPATLSNSPLAIPTYGVDGRPGSLDANKMMYGTKNPNDLSAGFQVLKNYPGYGVRALGTSSTMSETQLNFQTALNAVNTYRGQANGKASGAITTYGAALADMAIIRENEKATNSTEDYASYVPQLQGMITELAAANELVESALINAMVAISNANIPYGGDNKTIGDAEVTGTGKTVREYLKDGENLGMTVIWGNIPEGVKTEMNSKFPALAQAYNAWAANKTQINDTQSKITALAAKEGTISWTDVSPALSGLMNTNYVTLNGMALDRLDKNELIKNISNLNLELADGSGVLANFGKLTGNLSGTVELSENAEYSGQSLGGVKLNLVTTSQPAGGALLTQVRSTIYAVGAAASENSTTAIDVVYGYVLDFVFRTNAANSNLLLQTEGAQRIYGDSTNAATMGLGSTMTFADKLSNLESLVGMMSGIRVVFTNTVGESTEVYGIAKVVIDELALSVNLNSGSVEATPVYGEDGTTVTGYEFGYVEGAAAELPVYLTAVDVNGNVQLTLKAGDHKYIVVEEYEDENTVGKDFRWTVKTAMHYTQVTMVDVVDAEGTVTGQVPFEEVIELTDSFGNPIFYPQNPWNLTTGEIEEYTDVEKNDYLAEIETDFAIDMDADADEQTAETQKVSDAIKANWAVPTYYFAHDVNNANVEVEAPLYLHKYTIDANGVLGFGEPMDVQTLTSLDQNVITGVSALVYLDGDYVDNTMVPNSENGIATSGTMNLQFASSANLVPMENTALKDGEAYNVTITKPDGVTVLSSSDKAIKGQDYNFALLSNNYTVTYKVGDGTEKTLTGTQQEYGGQSGYVYTIPNSEVTGAITITIAEPTQDP